MNMEDCPVHSVEVNPIYPFTCHCKDTYTPREWYNVASSEYHSWAAWGEYQNWVREGPEAHNKYVRMLWDYQLVLVKMYRRWLLSEIEKDVLNNAMTDRYEILAHMKTIREMDYWDEEETDVND